MIRYFDHPSDMEPLLPEEKATTLEVRALDLIRNAERLRELLHPVTRRLVADQVRSMNSYYSNLIEGHRTRPADVEAALRGEFSENPGRRALQLQHLAHMEVQTKLEARLPAMSDAAICSKEFLSWLHAEFYTRMPPEFRKVEEAPGRIYEIEPGVLRQSEVSVGRHLAPKSDKLADFLARFESFYAPLVNKHPASLIAASAAHHRLAWIHPFLDGNGRVARLFTHAWFIKSGVDGNGLWTLSRGLARQQRAYQAALANADEKRSNDFDGPGYLSQRYLTEFCAFVIEVGSDQVAFMRDQLALDGLMNRVRGYGEWRESTGELPKGSARLLGDLMLRGEITRGEVARILGTSTRSGQRVSGKLLKLGLITSDSPKGLLRPGFPAAAAPFYFPGLYPTDSD